jgi:hypothetical protein
MRCILDQELRIEVFYCKDEGIWGGYFKRIMTLKWLRQKGKEHDLSSYGMLRIGSKPPVSAGLYQTFFFYES